MNEPRTSPPGFWAGSIRNRFIIFLIAFAVIPVVLISLISRSIGVNATNSRIYDTLSAIGTLKEVQLERWINDAQQELALDVANNSAQLMTLLRWDPDSQLFESFQIQHRRVMQSSVENNEFFDELILLNPQGRILISSDPTQEDKFVANRLYFRHGLAGPYLQPVTYDPSRRLHTLYVSRPIVDEVGETLGVIAARANTSRITDIMLERVGLGETGETYLVAANDALLTESRNTNYPIETTAIRTEGSQRAIDLNLIGAGVYKNYKGDPVFGNYRWIPSLQLAMLVEQHQAEAQASLQATNIATIAAVVGAIILAVIAAFYISRSFTKPLINLTQTAERIAGGDLDLQVTTGRQDEIGVLAGAFNRMTGQLRDLITNLEQRVNERTQQVQRRSDQVLAAADVGKSAATILDTNLLIEQVVKSIQERFNLYYVGLFLVDVNKEWAVLKAGTGAAGGAMIERGHRLKIGEGSMIGWSIANARARITLEAGEDPVRLATPDLPKTRSEVAIPLRSRGQVLGALSIQSSQSDAFDRDAITVFQTMADQVAVALDNANLFTTTQEAMEATQMVYGQISRQAWIKRLSERSLGYRRDASGLTHAGELQIEPPSPSGNGDSDLVVPIKARGQTIGFVRAKKPGEETSQGAWSTDEVGALQSLIDQLGVALDSARLFETTQQQAERDRLISEITDRMRDTPDINVVLQTAAREMRNALDLEEVEVRMGDPENISRQNQ